MNWMNSILILLAAYALVFVEAAFSGIRDLLGAQIDFLPALMVYAGLSSSLVTVCLAAMLGGLGFDSLSANPLGASLLPLFLIGSVVHLKRELILRELVFAQFVLGFIASALAPLLVVLLLLSGGHNPLLGWGSLWQWIVMALGGGLTTPVFFKLFGALNRALSYRRVTETSFRPDREIARGR